MYTQQRNTHGIRTTPRDHRRHHQLPYTKHGETVGTQQLLNAAEHFDCSFATVKKRLKDYKAGIGKWHLTVQEVREQLETVVKQTESLIPSKDANYVPFGNATDLKKIIKSKIFYPTFITGLSGNGKTLESSKRVPNSDVS